MHKDQIGWTRLPWAADKVLGVAVGSVETEWYAPHCCSQEKRTRLADRVYSDPSIKTEHIEGRWGKAKVILSAPCLRGYSAS